MRLLETEVVGVFEIEASPHDDERGAFARLYCPDEFAAAGPKRGAEAAAFRPVQVNSSRNTHAGTLRGMHYQNSPHSEAKLVHVTRGAIFDVAIDLRPESPSYRRWAGRRLDAGAMNALFIPEGCAHGFLTLEDETDVLYHMGRMFEPGHGQGFRWDDPAFGVVWPEAPKVMSERDRTYPDFEG